MFNMIEIMQKLGLIIEVRLAIMVLQTESKQLKAENYDRDGNKARLDHKLVVSRYQKVSGQQRKLGCSLSEKKQTEKESHAPFLCTREVRCQESSTRVLVEICQEFKDCLLL